MINHFLTRMLAIDPAYGAQKHQKDFLRLYDERQAKKPCPQDHEHHDECYRSPGCDGSFNAMGIR